ncbi:MAG: hypothetical protein SFX18_19970 [Pirellulales bacterium]|nr:hypothetical protein [Pirellulales bacterium]
MNRWTSTLFLSLSFVLAITAPTQANPILWPIEQGGNGHYYELVEEPQFWAEAISASMLRTPPTGYNPGHLATISGIAENEFLRFTYANNMRVGAWFGFTDELIEGEWRWIDNTPGIWQDPDNFAHPIQTAFVNWIPGNEFNPSEPNNHNGNEDYGLFSFENAFFPGFWNDGVGPNTGNKFAYVVEYEPIPEPSTMVIVGLLGITLLARKSPGLFRRKKLAGGM